MSQASFSFAWEGSSPTEYLDPSQGSKMPCGEGTCPAANRGGVEADPSVCRQQAYIASNSSLTAPKQPCYNPEQNNPGSVRETFISNSEGGEKQTRNGVSNLQCEIMRRICIYHELCLEKCCTQAGGEFAQGEFLGEHTLETGSRVNV